QYPDVQNVKIWLSINKYKELPTNEYTIDTATGKLSIKAGSQAFNYDSIWVEYQYIDATTPWTQLTAVLNYPKNNVTSGLARRSTLIINGRSLRFRRAAILSRCRTSGLETNACTGMCHLKGFCVG
ncbi:MAG: hypothetical protein HQK98_08945, partial [Nitrospirae bacterium]|nr:hypothetical protein [Nitrospirota bacterium]